MRIIGVIPARMAATRFPDKPLAPILGMPMLGHVYHRSGRATSLDEVWIATCDREVAAYARSIGAPVVMTADTHQRASDRVAEALEKIEAAIGSRVDYIALIQGDEPMLMPEMLDDLTAPVRLGEALETVNLISKIDDEAEFEDPDTVKVVLDRAGNILYFSREPIPSRSKRPGGVPMWKQLGLILFRRDNLLEYGVLEPTPLEVIESVDMNRLLEHGRAIRAVPARFPSHAVDRPEDIARVEALLREDALLPCYHDVANG